MRKILAFWGVVYLLVLLGSFFKLPFAPFGLIGYVLASGIFGWLAIIGGVVSLSIILFTNQCDSCKGRLRLLLLAMSPFVLSVVGCIQALYSVSVTMDVQNAETSLLVQNAALEFFLLALGGIMSLTCLSILFVKTETVRGKLLPQN